ncbi:MAG: bifunctional UDP-N-acetylglucosamine diphosphorylase/glucosamine-1-phosphate N-acetyltransferase GlmU [Nitrospirae bacterium]|nr:bifunctional UDP-N-acetylglucosamine diphosphorylase/glucosamine-1-phosphate N-acetyltransferase GlmU [Nitrospirota bacterium]MBF0535700.1 bifunctional UDP-N-acetylglucosamine diphosphorylase/glucosamine-1-phosphate N-acetyltransferase GlmU [Nitrospirota bacterium]MBF0617525.1 bifunctional UDP-N-acetylglucosamine diphosphorylase/glucosamine-1-phosphate N-acetyltransferase GlmU [Nitrospirota bacterium]
MENKKICSVILAAGLGKRMHSSLPKVLHRILGKPMICYTADCLSEISDIEKTVIVISRLTETVKDFIKKDSVEFAYQEKPLGTADALKSALSVIKDSYDLILVVTGDTPLIKSKTLENVVDFHLQNENALTVVTFNASVPGAYGRILRINNEISRIVELSDTSNEVKKITEVNSGFYVISASVLPLIENIRRNEKNGEFYLTDIVELSIKEGFKTEALKAADEKEFWGINSRQELLAAQRVLQKDIAEYLLNNGVTIMDPDSVFISPDVTIGKDTFIYPNVVLEGNTNIGSNCTIYPGTRLIDVVLEDDVVIKDSTLIEDSKILTGSAIGPFAHIRPGSTIGPKGKIGNFVEVKNSTIGYNSKASHLTYIGDSELGKDINVGAGTITCNYDGIKKHKTVIKDGVFVGSGTQLVAPVTINKNAVIAAGSTITKDVPEDALAVARAKQQHIDNWTLRKQPAKKE